MENNTGIELIKVKDSKEIFKIMYEFNNLFIRPIDSIVEDMKIYAEKISNNAVCKVCKDSCTYCGYIIFYMNDSKNKTGYISQLAVKKEFRKKGIGNMLLNDCIQTAKKLNYEYIKLEVDKINKNAIDFYVKHGFEIIGEASNISYYMHYKQI